VRSDEETGQTLIAGMGSSTWRSSSTPEARVQRRRQRRPAQVAYRETARNAVEKIQGSSSGRPVAAANTATRSST